MTALTDLPLELLEEVLVRLDDVRDVGAVAKTCTKMRSAAHLGTVWIRRCKRDFHLAVKSENSSTSDEESSVRVFYQVVLHRLGRFLGPLSRPSLDYYSGLYQLVHDGRLGLVCYQWQPPSPGGGMDKPMRLRRMFRIEARRVGERCEPTVILVNPFLGGTGEGTIESGSSLSVRINRCRDIFEEPDVYRAYLADFLEGEIGKTMDSLNGVEQRLLLEKFTRVAHARQNIFLEPFRLHSGIPPADVPIATGLFKADYGPHGTELIHLVYYDGSKFAGIKVTGDPNVPATKPSFRGELTSGICLSENDQEELFGMIEASEDESNRLPNYDPSLPPQPFRVPLHCLGDRSSCFGDSPTPTTCLSRFQCECQVAGDHYTHPSYIDGQWIVINEDVFAVVFYQLHTMNFYSRVPERELEATTEKELEDVQVMPLVDV